MFVIRIREFFSVSEPDTFSLAKPREKRIRFRIAPARQAGSVPDSLFRSEAEGKVSGTDRGRDLSGSACEVREAGNQAPGNDLLDSRAEMDNTPEQSDSNGGDSRNGPDPTPLAPGPTGPAIRVPLGPSEDRQDHASSCRVSGEHPVRPTRHGSPPRAGEAPRSPPRADRGGRSPPDSRRTRRARRRIAPRSFAICQTTESRCPGARRATATVFLWTSIPTYVVRSDTTGSFRMRLWRRWRQPAIRRDGSSAPPEGSQRAPRFYDREPVVPYCLGLVDIARLWVL